MSNVTTTSSTASHFNAVRQSVSSASRKVSNAKRSAATAGAKTKKK